MAHTTSPIDTPTVTALNPVAQREQDVRRQVYSSRLSEDTSRQTYASMGTCLKQASVRRLTVTAAR